LAVFSLKASPGVVKAFIDVLASKEFQEAYAEKNGLFGWCFSSRNSRYR
jgi:ABC-type Fe3+ transport system substrate-binding protein